MRVNSGPLGVALEVVVEADRQQVRQVAEALGAVLLAQLLGVEPGPDLTERGEHRREGGAGRLSRSAWSRPEADPAGTGCRDERW